MPDLQPDQVMRLLRTRWQNASLLAEELFAMLDSKIPMTRRSPVTIEIPSTSTAPALTIRNDGGGPMIQFTRGGQDLGSIDNTGNLVDPPKNGHPAQPKAGSGTGTSIDFAVFSGKVIGGSGSTYTMWLYDDGGTTPIQEGGVPKVFTVKQQQIDPSATIPIDTWAPVFSSRGVFWMVAPVWM